MYQLYIANKNYSSWSLRPWALMRELGIGFVETLVPFGPGSNWTEYRRFSPNGRVPCLHDGDAQVWDSLAIVEYLAERHAGVWPADAAARAWARCAAAEMHSSFPALRNICPMSCGVRVRPRALPESVLAEVARIDELWSQGLARFGGPYLAGPTFTAVDAFFAPVVFRIRSYGLQLGEPAMAYVQRMLQTQSLGDWMAAALAETWREPSHEAEVLAAGDLVEDLRAGA